MGNILYSSSQKLDDKQEKMRERILEEILTTERNYVKTLDDIIQVRESIVNFPHGYQLSIFHRRNQYLTLFHLGFQAAVRSESEFNDWTD